MIKFNISSSLLSSNLQSIGKVISSKNTLPILDYFLFEISGSDLRVTASDLETTLIATLEIDNQGADGSVAIPARRITDSIKEFSEQPLTISVDSESWEVTISWRSGKLSIPGITGLGYPEAQEVSQVDGDSSSFEIPSHILYDGIVNTIFATADDQLRPVMNGIHVALSSDGIVFVATDAHRLVKYTNSGVVLSGGAATGGDGASFILPQKPAQLLKAILSAREVKDGSGISVSFDSKNVVFLLPKHRLVCRLIEGNYPNYNAVIPQNNPHIITVDRADLIASIKRVSVCANQASGLIKFLLGDSNLNLTAQDIDYSAAAEDNIPCNYTGDSIEIGFKAPFLLDLLSNVHTDEVVMELADSTRPGLFLPATSDTTATATTATTSDSASESNDAEETVYGDSNGDATDGAGGDARAKSGLLMLLMPMMINA